jgi:hypothetical protein
VSNDCTFIVWADPGLLTGLAWYDLEADRFGSGQYAPNELVRKVDSIYQVAGSRMAIGYEMFINTSGGARTSSPQHSHKAIAQLAEVASQYRIPLLKPQPSSARKLGNVVYLRRLGWYKPGRGHANDASQHLLAYLLKQKPVPAKVRAKLFPGYVPVVPSPPE